MDNVDQDSGQTVPVVASQNGVLKSTWQQKQDDLLPTEDALQCCALPKSEQLLRRCRLALWMRLLAKVVFERWTTLAGAGPHFAAW